MKALQQFFCCIVSHFTAPLYMYMKRRCETALPACVCVHRMDGHTALTCDACVHVFVVRTRMRYPDNHPRRLFGYQRHVKPHSGSVPPLSNTVSSLRNIIQMLTFHLQPFLFFYFTGLLLIPKWQELDSGRNRESPALTASLIKER